MNITQLKKTYKNKWVLCEVLKEDKNYNLQEVKPLVVSSDRNEVYDALSQVKKGSHVATIYTGQVPPKGMVYAFYGDSSLQSSR